jgi:hypothetical protein
MTGFFALLALAVLAGGALTWIGVRTVRESRAGRSVSAQNDPTQPGFEAFLEPTPTLLVLHTDGEELVSVMLLALHSGDAGGGALLIPTSTVAAGGGPFTLGAIATLAGTPTQVTPAVQSLLAVGLPETAIVDDARWAALVAPVSPLTIQNPDELDGFPAGTVSLPAERVGEWLSATRPGESELGRLYRQQLFLEAWATAIAASDDPAVVPGEVESGIGRFARGLAGGGREIATLPVVEGVAENGTPRFEVDEAGLEALLPSIVPFPTASRPGGRFRVRLLDGTGDPAHIVAVGPRLGPAGAEIVVVGNAERFDHRETEIRYHEPSYRDEAEAVRQALGAGVVIEDVRPTDAFDVTIVAGTDL